MIVNKSDVVCILYFVETEEHQFQILRNDMTLTVQLNIQTSPAAPNIVHEKIIPTPSTNMIMSK